MENAFTARFVPRIFPRVIILDRDLCSMHFSIASPFYCPSCWGPAFKEITFTTCQWLLWTIEERRRIESHARLLSVVAYWCRRIFFRMAWLWENALAYLTIPFVFCDANFGRLKLVLVWHRKREKRIVNAKVFSFNASPREDSLQGNKDKREKK